MSDRAPDLIESALCSVLTDDSGERPTDLNDK